METGTSFGINALYMAGPSRVSKVVTVEASPIIASIAMKQFEKVFQDKIEIRQGTIQEVLESEVIKMKPELCFIDADHRSSAVGFCLETLMKHSPEIQCIIVHDIYWSADMLEAWNRIVQDPRFPLTVDLFQAGAIFPQLETPKQHFTIRF